MSVKRLRGYVASRPFFAHRVPQHVQNIVIRDYCSRRGYTYLLSATEYAMPACYMMLEDALNELPNIDGIVMYSIFMLPRRPERRREIYRRILDAGASLHGAVETIALDTQAHVQTIEDIWMTQEIVSVNNAPADVMRSEAYAASPPQ